MAAITIPTVAASSSATASGGSPDQPKKETSTFWVFWAMKITSRSISTTSRVTATQVALVREPRSGSPSAVGDLV